MHNSRRIDVAKEFSATPSGRHPNDGPNNGTRFRDDFLVPALRKFPKVIVCLDDTEGFGSSFLEEAFGGLARMGFTPDEIKKQLTLEAKTPSGIKYKKRVERILDANS